MLCYHLGYFDILFYIQYLVPHWTHNKFSPHFYIHWIVSSLIFSNLSLFFLEASFLFPHPSNDYSRDESEYSNSRICFIRGVGLPTSEFSLFCSQLCSQNPQETECWGEWSDILKFFSFFSV